MRKAIVRQVDRFVENIIEWEEGTSWLPPTDCYLIDAGDGSPGDTWDGIKFIKPVMLPPIDYKALWAEAKAKPERERTEAMFNVIAKRLELE